LDAALNALSKVSILKDALMAHKKLCS